MIKSKKQRQKWWKNLPIGAKKAFIHKKVAEKAEYRINRSKQWLKDNKLTFDCSVCIHHLSKSCEDEKRLSGGCEYWENLVIREVVPLKFQPYWV